MLFQVVQILERVQHIEGIEKAMHRFAAELIEESHRVVADAEEDKLAQTLIEIGKKLDQVLQCGRAFSVVF